MKYSFSTETIGNVALFIQSKSFKIKSTIILFSSILLFGAFPYFNNQGPGLQTPGTIAPYANGKFPDEADIGLDVTYRVAYPNLRFNGPIAFKPVPNQNRIMIAQLDGAIFWFDNDETTTIKNPMLDLSGDVGIVHDGGFLGLALHPDFNATVNPKNYIYVYYTSKNSAGQNSPAVGSHTGQGCTHSEDRNEYQGNKLRLRRFTVDPTDLSIIPNSEIDLLKIRMYGTTHYGGGLDFGNDGFLYLTIGDQASWRRAQDITDNLSGGLLRLDVDKDPTKSHAPIRTKQVSGNADEVTGIEYWIPNDNPFLSPDGSTYEEYYSIGLRNPFRMTKDKLTGEFYIGDVGLSSFEEINVVKKGANYGWPQYEGFNNRGTGCAVLLDGMPHEEPLTAFARTDANAIAGGFVYRGSAIPDLYGKYLSADYGGGGEIFSIDTSSGDYEQIASLNQIISFGEDSDGELFLLTHAYNQNIYKLVEGVDDAYATMPQLLSETEIFTDLTTLEVNEGIVPYELYESFWSDGALKRRWIAVPNTDGVYSGPEEQIKYSEYNDWEFPPGTVIIKQFNLQIDDNNPSITKKIETRFSIVDKNGDWYFLTYNWNDTQTDAVLQTTSLNETVTIATDNNGGTRTQTWHFPSNTECNTCHNEANKGNLGLKTRYLNTDYLYEETGLVGNQLVTLSHLGILNQTITDVDASELRSNKPINDLTASLDDRARSYLDLNCAYCHRLDNPNRTTFDLRLFNSLEATGLLTAGILNPLGIDPNEKIIYPGEASKSILFHKMNSVDQAIMMPPLAKLKIDQPAVDLIEQWINQLDSNTTEVNTPNPMSNLALLPSAINSGFTGPGMEQGRGTPFEILYEPLTGEYKTFSQYAEYGVKYLYNQGTVNAENGFFWRVDWPNPKFVNYITIGGSYGGQSQQYTMWRISYLREGNWVTINEGKGGWINAGIFEWGGDNQTPIFAEALRVQLYSDGIHDVKSIHLRGRGASTGVGNNNPNNPFYNDVNTEPKATLVQFVPYNTPTIIESVVAGLQQTTCSTSDNTYSQDLIVTYSNPPETGSLVVNGQSFPITSSPQTITLTGLISDGQPVEVEAEFTDGYKSIYSSHATVFTAPDNCIDLIVGVDETLLIDGDYTVPPVGKIEIFEGGSLTITGNLTIHGDVVLNSISNKYSSLIVEGTSTGNLNYKRHVNAFNGTTGNDLISSPVSGQTFGDFASSNQNLYENPNNTAQKLFGPFDETVGAYETYSTDTNATTNINLGIGYRAARESQEDATYGTTLTFYGGIDTNTVTRNISTSGSSFDGWNLIGNPYTAYIDFDAFFEHNKANLNGGPYQAIYGYDGDASNGWTILNNLTTGQLIAPGQGFFVKSKPGGGVITFTPEMRVSGNTDDFILGRSNTSAHLGYIKLKASTLNSEYHTDIYFNSNATLGLDPGYDAALYSGNIPEFSMYSHLVDDNSDIPLMIQALGENAMTNVSIALGVHANQGQEITITIHETDIPDAINVYLEDTSNNTFTLLNINDYTFTATNNLSGVGRFYLRFENDVLHLNNPSFDTLKISTNQLERTVEVTGQLEVSTSFTLYDIHGRVILSTVLDGTSTQQSIDVHHLNTGIYIVELETISGAKRTQKLIIK
ncbi:PQQ-dependent sugar dehydrogenase [Winogradskyella sp. PC D3.3]